TPLRHHPRSSYGSRHEIVEVGTGCWLLVGGLNEHVKRSTVVPGGCSTLMVADTKAKSVIRSVHWGVGQSGAPVIGFGDGAAVVTANGVLPFLISDAGIASEPATLTCAGFCPGG